MQCGIVQIQHISYKQFKWLFKTGPKMDQVILLILRLEFLWRFSLAWKYKPQRQPDRPCPPI